MLHSLSVLHTRRVNATAIKYLLPITSTKHHSTVAAYAATLPRIEETKTLLKHTEPVVRHPIPLRAYDRGVHLQLRRVSRRSLFLVTNMDTLHYNDNTSSVQDSR